MALGILDLTKNFVQIAVQIFIKTDKLNFKGIWQFHVVIKKEEWKLDDL